MQNNQEKPAPSIPVDAPEDPAGDLAESDFLTRLRAEFIANPIKWPKNFDTGKTNKAVAELQAAFRWMFLALERPSEARPKLTKGSAVKIVSDVAKQTKWPKTPSKGGPDVAKGWDDHPRAFRRYEIGAAMNILMNAFNRGGPGGTGSSWPPQRPA